MWAGAVARDGLGGRGTQERTTTAAALPLFGMLLFQVGESLLPEAPHPLTCRELAQAPAMEQEPVAKPNTGWSLLSVF